MTLIVYTARISCTDPDRFDITRRSGGVDGHPFAPSWAILRPALDAREEGERLVKFARQPDLRGTLLEAYVAKAERLNADAWAAYVPAYTEEMRRSYRANRAAWDALLARPRVALVCYCSAPTPDKLRCHRRLLAGILVKLGAADAGEL